MSKLQNIFSKFLKNDKSYPLLTGLATGLYPLIFYYTNNFTLINSLKHLAYFVGLFIIFPIGLFFLLDMLFKRTDLSKRKKYINTFLNVLAFLIFIELCLYADIQVVISVVIVIIALLAAFFLNQHLKKIVVIQLILALLGLISLVPVLIKQLNYSSEWMNQPDDISEVVFKKRPNVYYIQPDGYLNFSELTKGYYNYSNTDFKDYLEGKNFTLYDDVRSNYNATMISNTSAFAMKHHYNNIGFNLSEVINGREIIITENPVLDIFDKNNYKTHFLAEWPFFLWNLPEMGYDACNYDYKKDVNFVGKGYYRQKDIVAPLKNFIEEDQDKSKFFFIQVFKPGHVKFYENESKGAEAEKAVWFERLAEADRKLKELIDIITTKDPSALIIMMADHGGYVGFDYMEEIHTKTQDRDKLYSAFSVHFSVKWPDGKPYEHDSNFKSSVNMFRVLFSYLAEESKYLDHLEEDSSFIVIEKGAPKGVYQCINAEGEVTFKKRTGI